jgi:predicted dehydrogenase
MLVESNPMNISNAVLFGFGHHGRNRLYPGICKLEQIEKITLCDIDTKKFDTMDRSDRKEISVTNNIDTALENASAETFVVIGTTAKDHLAILAKAGARGVKNVYMEKPLVQSMADLDKMAILIEHQSIRFAAGYYNDFLTLVDVLENLRKEHHLGELLKISSEGGAVCMSTNGSHVIDLANLLFGSSPKEIMGRINTTIPGPRGNDYSIHDGIGHVWFENGKELLLGYNNRSLNAHTVRLHFEFGQIDAGYFTGKIKIFGHSEEIRKQPKYRYDVPLEVAEISVKDDLKIFIETIFQNFLNGGSYCGFERAYRSTVTLLGILISDKERKTIAVPIEKENKYYHERFPIT